MSIQKSGVNRREFMKSATGLVALGGGLYMLAPLGKANAAFNAEEVLHAWDSPWRPTSPKRLSDVIHELAGRAFSGEHGRGMKNAEIWPSSTSDYSGGEIPLGGAKRTRLICEPNSDFASSLITVEVRLRLKPSSQYQVPIARGPKGPGHWELYAMPDTGRLGCYTPDLSPPDGQSEVSITDDAWHRVGWTHDGTTTRLYVDGNLVLSQERSGEIANVERRLVLGSLVEDGFFCDGAFKELRISDIARDLSGQTGDLLADSHTVSLWRAADLDQGILHGRGSLETNLTLTEKPVGISPNREYALATMQVAKEAPLRVLPGERIVGSATLLEAPAHRTPVAGVGSTSHTTIGFHRVLETGYKGLREQIRERLARGDLDENRIDLLESMKICLDAADIWHKRYLDLLDDLAADATDREEREGYLSVRRTLERVPKEPPRTFHEAVQSLWFMYAFQRLMGNWSGIGRIDEMLGPYLERDLAEKRITLDEAREILAHFWVKGCEWIGAFDTRGSGDAQHYQNIVLSGVDREGRDVTNEVTYLVLDVVEELHISDFPIAVRVNSHTPEKLLRRIAEVQRHGGGIVALYNEEVVIDGLVQFGYPIEEARCFANDGCWETIIPGKTAFIYSPFDLLGLLQKTLGLQDPGQTAPEYPSFDSLYGAFLTDLQAHIDSHNEAADNAWKHGLAAPLLSMFVEDCIERGRGYYDRGSRYNVFAPHAGGMANVGNSLLAIKKLVYEEQRFTLSEFVEILRNDWKDQEQLRQQVLGRIGTYGNDNQEADVMTCRVFNDYADIVAKVRDREGVLRPAGISTFGREIAWRHPHGGRKATPDGHRIGETLATNMSPSPGTDRNGPTAVLKSYCKMDFTRTPNGATVELKMHPESTKGERGIDGLVALMRSFVRLDGMFLHVDVVDSEMLRDAQLHPEKYPNLSVRIAGWSARFATLDEDWQNMIIGRTQQIL